MSILLHARKAVLSPPKCGTHTVNRVMQNLGTTLLTGHMFLPDAKRRLQRDYPQIPPDELEWAMPVRDPIERFVSIVNHQFGKRKENLDYVYEEIVASRLHLFNPIHKYLVGIPPNLVRLFRFETFEICRWLGWTHAVPHELPGEYRWTREEILGHKHFPEAIRPYLPDFKLREHVLHAS